MCESICKYPSIKEKEKVAGVCGAVVVDVYAICLYACPRMIL